MKNVLLIPFLALALFGAGCASINPTPSASAASSLSRRISSAASSTLVIEPDAGVAPVISMIQSAKKSVDLVMYELEDTQVERALVADQARGVTVRVLLNQGYFGAQSKDNVPAYQFLSTNKVAVKWTPSYFALTHEKSLVVDGSQALIMTFNLTPQYYSSSRDFGLVDDDPKDVAAMESTFDADWKGTKIASANGDDLVWSPGSEPQTVSVINSATSSLDVYNEEMSDKRIISALEAAAKRGVTVNVDMTDSSDWSSAFQALTSAGVHVRTYAAKATLYIHAKMVLADGKTAFVGSENFSATSLNQNRELGLDVSDPKVLTSLLATFNADWSVATPFGSKAPTPQMPATTSTTASPMPTTSTNSTMVKLSTTGICHVPGDSSYDQTTHFTSYATLQDCLNAGGREPKN
ncbi:MAG: phospholipase D-like domain-containing protein [Patescibacteria group bacterium]